MSETKDNHYVPRLYLRNFTQTPESLNGSFDFFNIKSGKHVGVIPHGSQMKERYFYKKGTDIETRLNQEFEGKHARIIKDILDNQATSESLVEVVLLMHFRTRAQRDEDLFFRRSAIDQHLDYLVSSFKESFPFWIRILVWTRLVKDADIIKIVRQGAYQEYLKKTDSSEKQIKNFERIKEEMKGLEAVVLHNSTTTNLVSSDRPVILLNPFLQQKKVKFGTGGMFQMGIILLLPISPKKVLLCYDPNIYENPTADKLTEQDVINLNKLQILSAVEALYSESLPSDIADIASAVLKEKQNPKLITVHLPGDYELTYKDSGLPLLDLTFVREKKGTDLILLRIPYARSGH